LRAGLIAAAVLVIDQLPKIVARASLAECLDDCDSTTLLGPLRLVHVSNSGSVLGFAEGLWLWIALAILGLALIPLYARRLPDQRLGPAIGVGLQLGGALSNVLDRVVTGGVTDYLRFSRPPSFNLADVALVVGTVITTVYLARAEFGRGARNVGEAG
jgi:signal peptidase II